MGSRASRKGSSKPAPEQSELCACGWPMPSAVRAEVAYCAACSTRPQSILVVLTCPRCGRKFETRIERKELG
jgi:predicted RNA-binding Zn-ribbon protein involved in translation (DUF1610 family)